MDEKLLELAAQEGLYAAIIPTADVPIEPKFRVFCEENLCGNYGANYACPPDCGSVEQLRRNILAQEKALVVSTIWHDMDLNDKAAIHHAKMTHNAAVLRLLDKVRALGCTGFCTGYNGCPLCNPCKRRENKPCVFPDKRISCMSAYCIDVGALARRCNLEFGWLPDKLFLFGMIAYREP